MTRRTALRAGLVLVLGGSLGGCAWVSSLYSSWFSKAPPAKALPVVRTEAPAPVATPVVAPEAAPDNARSAAAARAVCPNYAQAFEDSSYPRDAIIRGLDRGKASIRFQVAGSTLTILTVTSSDPSFGDAAAQIVRKLQCRVEQPTVFEIPFEWRSRP